MVQSLAGVSYSLAAAADRVDNGADGAGLGSALRQSAADTRRSMRELRSLIVEIAPPNLHEEGLDNALGELVASLAAEGVTTSIHVEDDAAPSPETQTLLYRVAQEAVRNVAAQGHVGLTLLTGLVADAGGRLVVASTPGQGTRVEAEVPVA